MTTPPATIFIQSLSAPTSDGWRAIRCFIVEGSQLLDVEVDAFYDGKWELDDIEILHHWPPRSEADYDETPTETLAHFATLRQAIIDRLNDDAVAAAENRWER